MSILPDFKLETFFSRWEFNVKYNMCASDMESMPMLKLIEMSSEVRQEESKSILPDAKIIKPKIKKLGKIGELVKVKDGYARNYLFPNKMALRENKKNTQNT